MKNVYEIRAEIDDRICSEYACGECPVYEECCENNPYKILWAYDKYLEKAKGREGV